MLQILITYINALNFVLSIVKNRFDLTCQVTFNSCGITNFTGSLITFPIMKNEQIYELYSLVTFWHLNLLKVKMSIFKKLP